MRLGRTFLQAMIVSSLFLPISLSSARADTIRQSPPMNDNYTAGRETAGAVGYELSSAAAYYEGCVGPCKCPVKTAGMKGTFKLVRLASDKSSIRCGLDDISWAVITPTGEVMHKIMGTGTYQIDTTSRMHRLVLDVGIDNKEQVHLDSGQVPDGSRFPAITIPVDRGAECYNIWMDIDANPSR